MEKADKAAILNKVANCSTQLEKDNGFGSWLTDTDKVVLSDLNSQVLTIKGQENKNYITAVFEKDGKIVGEVALGSFMGEVFVGTIEEATAAVLVIGGENPLYRSGFALKTNTTLYKKVGVLKNQLERMLGEEFSFEVVNGFQAPFNLTKLNVTKGIKAKSFWKSI